MVSPPRSFPDTRLRLKRAFSRYYMDLCSAGIATPTEAYETCTDYLVARAEQWGDELLAARLDEDLNRLSGEIEQDLRQRHRGHIDDCLAKESLEGRLRECAEVARMRAGL